jgi:hypothetical protein
MERTITELTKEVKRLAERVQGVEQEILEMRINRARKSGALIGAAVSIPIGFVLFYPPTNGNEVE